MKSACEALQKERRQRRSHPALASQMLQRVCVPAAQSLGLVATHHNPRESFPLLSRVQLDSGFQFPEPAEESTAKSIKLLWMAISL